MLLWGGRRPAARSKCTAVAPPHPTCTPTPTLLFTPCRMLLLWVVGFTARCKYYFAWAVAESSLIFSGLCFNGWKEVKVGGKAAWAMSTNLSCTAPGSRKSATPTPSRTPPHTHPTPPTPQRTFPHTTVWDVSILSVL